MKKIYIITVEKTLNYGAYLQAYALYDITKQYAEQVSLVKTHSRHPYQDTIKQIVKAFLKLDFKRVNYARQLLKSYVQSWKKVKFSEINKITKDDIVITGSDEIWNIHRKACLENPIFFGEGIPTNNLIAYAPSCNITTVEEFEKQPHLVQALTKYHCIGVRDKHTQEVISHLVDQPITVVTDPTLLHPVTFYESIEQGKKLENYIVVYGDSNFTKEEIEEIKQFAKKENKKLIAPGLYQEWCDENIPVSPFEFLSLIHHADYVITNSFHACVFSTLYHKNFVAYCEKKKKVINFLEEMGLQNRDREQHGSLLEVIEEPIDYEKVNRVVEKKRLDSLEFLRNTIKELE